MSLKAQVILSRGELTAFKAHAIRAGVSLSAWLREAAHEKAAAADAAPRSYTAPELQALFAAHNGCYDSGAEPGWDDVKAMLRDDSRSASRHPTRDWTPGICCTWPAASGAARAGSRPGIEG